MKLQKAGEIPADDSCFLETDWYKRLNKSQLEAYVRYLFVAHKTKAYSPEAIEHRQKKLKWDGGCDSYGTRYKRLWSKIVDFMASVDADPGIWVAAHFSPVFHAVRVAENKCLIDNRPELLQTNLSYDIYERYTEVFSHIVSAQCSSAEISVATQLKTLDSIITDPDDRVFYIVSDRTNVNAPPFFRHALAALFDCARGVKKYQAPAVVEYSTNQRLYDELLREPENDWWVTAAQKQNAIKFRKYWSRVDD